MPSHECEYCNYSFAQTEQRCPHCARPSRFPNVIVAEEDEEKKALETRYQKRFQEADTDGLKLKLSEFEGIINSDSQAVIARNITELQRLAKSDKELYATYYQLMNAGIRLPSGDKWDRIRQVADPALFPSYFQEIRFANLTLDGMGLKHYGDCMLILDEKMIGHRATVFEENSVVFMRHHKILVFESDKLPKGYRATWESRGKLGVAKLADKINIDTKSDEYVNIIMNDGAVPEDDEFIEVHIFGPMSIRTVKRVLAKSPRKNSSRIILKALKESLKKMNIEVTTN